MLRIMLFTLFCHSILSPAQATIFEQVQLPNSELRFISKQMNVPMKGQFSQFAVQLHFDPEKLETAQISVEIQVNSIDVGGEEANEIVKGKGWFQAASFPTAKFVAQKIKMLEQDRFEAAGLLTVKDITRPVVAPFSLKRTDKTGIFSGSLTMKRLDFDLGSGVWADTEVVANEVEISFKINSLSQ